MKRRRLDLLIDKSDPSEFYDATTIADYSSSGTVSRIQRELTVAAKTLSLAGDVVLDLGCGSGLSLEHLLLPTNHVIGVDISPAMLHKAQDRLTWSPETNNPIKSSPLPQPKLTNHWDLILCDLRERLPFRHGTCDTVVSVSALQWLLHTPDLLHSHVTPDPPIFGLLNELGRVVAERAGPKGIAATSALQFYPATDEDLETTEFALEKYRAQCSEDKDAHLLMAWPHDTCAIKYFVILGCGKAGTGPAQSETGPAQSETGPAQSETGPAQSETGPAQSETGPAQSEDGPAPSESPHPIDLSVSSLAVARNTLITDGHEAVDGCVAIESRSLLDDTHLGGRGGDKRLCRLCVYERPVHCLISLCGTYCTRKQLQELCEDIITRNQQNNNLHMIFSAGGRLWDNIDGDARMLFERTILQHINHITHLLRVLRGLPQREYKTELSGTRPKKMFKRYRTELTTVEQDVLVELCREVIAVHNEGNSCNRNIPKDSSDSMVNEVEDEAINQIGDILLNTGHKISRKHLKEAFITSGLLLSCLIGALHPALASNTRPR